MGPTTSSVSAIASAMVLAAESESDEGGGGWILIFLLCVVAPIVIYVAMRRGEQVRFETTTTPRQAIMASLGVVGTKRGWSTLAQGSDYANYTFAKRANWLVAIILLLLFVVPGVVYLILAGKKESLTVNTFQPDPATTIVQCSSNGRRGKLLGRTLRKSLGVDAGSSGRTHDYLHRYASGAPAAPEPTTPPLAVHAPWQQPGSWQEDPARVEGGVAGPPRLPGPNPEPPPAHPRHPDQPAGPFGPAGPPGSPGPAGDR